jgi:hypothetical protein
MYSRNYRPYRAVVRNCACPLPFQTATGNAGPDTLGAIIAERGPMGFLSGIFDPPETKRHRKAASAAAALRQQAARDLFIELQVLVPIFRGAAARHQQVYAAGDHASAARYADALEAADELMQRIERVTPEIQAEVARRQRAASCAADWEKYATWELEGRNVFLQAREQVTERTAQLLRLNGEYARPLGAGEAAGV